MRAHERSDSDRSSRNHLRSLHPTLDLPIQPSHWWRTRSPRSFRRRDVKAIRASLLNTRIDGEDWLLAVTGDAATAIGIAVRQLKAHGMTCSIVDDAVSAVLCCALEGDGAARTLVESALRRRRKIDARCDVLIPAWHAARF